MSVDVLFISLGSTVGLRAADQELVGSLERAGASVRLVSAKAPRELPTFGLTDLSWSLAARKAASQALSEGDATALIYSTTTASLLWPRAGAIRFDAPAAANRPGRHGVWQRPVERSRLRAAPLLLPQSEGALAEVPESAQLRERALVVPVPVEPYRSGAERGAPEHAGRKPGAREIDAITYGANPAKKGLDRVLDAWAQVRAPGEELLVAGVGEQELRAAGYRVPADGVQVVGRLAPHEYRSLLARSKVFVCAPRREDYGIAQLEALIDGCLLVSTPAPGPYEALAIARRLDPRLVGEDLAGALRIALDDPIPGYALGAEQALAPYRRAAVDGIVAERLLPALLGPR